MFKVPLLCVTSMAAAAATLPWLPGCGSNESSPIEGSCDSDSDCASTEVCIDQQCDSRGQVDEPCRRDGSCSAESNVTVDGVRVPLACDTERNACVARGEEDAPCLANETCSDPDFLFCSDAGRCERLRELGDACAADGECGGDYCNPSGRCGPAEPGEPCDADRGRDACGLRAVCVGTCVLNASVPRGESCEVDAQCETQFCRDGVCDLAAYGEACGACEEGLVCTEGTCRRDAGSACTSSGECGRGLPCETALDGARRCVDGPGTPCNERVFDGDFYNICTDACLTTCKACYWSLEVGRQAAYCTDTCDGFTGDGDCYD